MINILRNNDRHYTNANIQFYSFLAKKLFIQTVLQDVWNPCRTPKNPNILRFSLVGSGGKCIFAPEIAIYWDYEIDIFAKESPEALIFYAEE